MITRYALDQVLVAMLLCTPFAAPSAARAGRHAVFYVAPAGADSNSGAFSAPFATLERARDAVRAERKRAPGTACTVYLRGGLYPLHATVAFNERDSGQAGAPVLFKAWAGEEVRLSGGVRIASGRVGPVSDSTVANRLITRVRDKILQIDIAGVPADMSRLQPHGFGRPYSMPPPELFGRERAYVLARWPNRGYTGYDRVVAEGSRPCDGDTSGRGGVIVYQAGRIDRWQHAEEPWISGFFHYGFADDAVAVGKVDSGKKELTTAQPTFYGFAAGEKFNGFYGFNMLEEIDLPGEYYLDRRRQRIYFYPFDHEDFSDLSLSLCEAPLLAIENAACLRFEGITFECTRGMGACIEGGHDIQFISCTFRNIGTIALCFGQGVGPDGRPASRMLGHFKEYLYSHQTWDRHCGSSHLVENCEIYNIGAGGIILGGGDRITLTPGHNRVSNCAIHDFNRHEKSYRGAINLDGVGNIIDHNEIYNCPGVAIHLNGNDHRIEYNILHDAVTDGHDMGALYYGRNPGERGTIVRYNYFHHIGPREGLIMSIYHDDGACGMQVYGNLFYKPGTVAVMIGGGSDIVYRNNIFVDVPLAFHIDNRVQNWAGAEFAGPDGLYRRRLEEVGYDRSPYAEAYPELCHYWEAPFGLPRRNLIEDNLFCSVGQFHNGAPEWVQTGRNYFTDGDPGFAQMARMDFRLRSDASVYALLPDFKMLPLAEMGRQRPARSAAVK